MAPTQRIAGVQYLTHPLDILCVAIVLGDIYLILPDVHPPPLHRTLPETNVSLVCLWLCLHCRLVLHWKHDYNFDTVSAIEIQLEQNNSWILRQPWSGGDGCSCN